MGILWNPENTSSVAGFKETEEAARALAMQLQSVEVRGADDFAGAFQAARKAKARALTVVSDSLMFSNRRQLLELASKYKLPTMHTQSLWVDAGALMSDERGCGRDADSNTRDVASGAAIVRGQLARSIKLLGETAALP